MIKRLTVAALGLAAVLGTSPARADYMVYTNRAAFEAAITGESTETFNELGGTLQVFNGAGLSGGNGLNQPLAITGSNNFLLSSSASALAGYYPANGTYLLGPISNTASDGITVGLPANSYAAAGADVGVFASNSLVSFLVRTSDGSSFTSRIQVDANSPSAALGFLGVVLTTPGDFVTSLTFSAPVGSAQNVLIDNVSTGFSPLSVPEPASMALFGAGSLAIGVSAVRRRVLKGTAGAARP